jgi:hypothetical protein
MPEFERLIWGPLFGLHLAGFLLGPLLAERRSFFLLRVVFVHRGAFVGLLRARTQVVWLRCAAALRVDSAFVSGLPRRPRLRKPKSGWDRSDLGDASAGQTHTGGMLPAYAPIRDSSTVGGMQGDS